MSATSRGGYRDLCHFASFALVWAIISLEHTLSPRLHEFIS